MVPSSRRSISTASWRSSTSRAASTTSPTSELNAPRDRAVRALDYLAEQGWIDLRAEGTRNQYRRLRLPDDAAALAGPMALLARPPSRRHYVTITFLDEESRSQVVILELGKDIVRSTLNTLEARSGKPIEYRDEAARKWIRE